MTGLLFRLLLLLVALAPLPLGANREWAWLLCAWLSGVLALGWAVYAVLRPDRVSLSPWNQSRAWSALRVVVGEDPGLASRGRR